MITIHKEDIKDFRGLGMKVQFSLNTLIEKNNFFVSNNDNFYNQIDKHHIKKEKLFFTLLEEIENIDFNYYTELKANYLNGVKIPSTDMLINYVNNYYNFKK